MDSYKSMWEQSRLWRASIIAQDDDNDYQESGWLCRYLGDDMYGLVRYGHCSCYDTWEAVSDESPDWEGTREEILDMARNKRDPYFPERESDPKDYDYDHLMAVYQTIIEKLS